MPKPSVVIRVFRVLAGFTLLAIGIALLVLPGPGWLIIVGGLALLAAEFAWARWALSKVKAGGRKLVFWNRDPNRDPG